MGRWGLLPRKRNMKKRWKWPWWMEEEKEEHEEELEELKEAFERVASRKRG